MKRLVIKIRKLTRKIKFILKDIDVDPALYQLIPYISFIVFFIIVTVSAINSVSY